MGFKHRNYHILIRILMLAALIASAFYSIFALDNMLRGSYLFAFAILVIGELLFYLDRTHRDLTTFFTSILNDDFTTVFASQGRGKRLAAFYDALNQITARFRDLSTEKEMQFQYLKTVVEHIDIGMLSVDAEGHIVLVNEKLKQLLRQRHIAHVDDLVQANPVFAEAVMHLAPGQQQVLRLDIGHELQQLALQATRFKLEEQTYTLVSVQDIKGPLEATELAAWQKLIRTLTHEIMNSATPISSLTDTLLGLLNSADDAPLTEKQRANLRLGLQAISERSKGLTTFTTAYRDLTRIPTPSFAWVNVRELLDAVTALLAQDLDQANIDLSLEIDDPDLQFFVDRQLLEQVLINLMQNAMDALNEVPKPTITVRATAHANDRIALYVEDNGTGIPADLRDEIFVPFFSTKETGSGIGLSLSRQIILKHKGSLTVQSQEGEGTTFTIIV